MCTCPSLSQVKAETGFNVSHKVMGIGAALGALELEQKKEKSRESQIWETTAFLWEMKGILHKGAVSADAVAIR